MIFNVRCVRFVDDQGQPEEFAGWFDSLDAARNKIGDAEPRPQGGGRYVATDSKRGINYRVEPA